MKSHALILALSGLFLAPGAQAADLVAEIRAKVTDPTKPITLIVDLPLPPALAIEFKDVVKRVRANEPGTLHYLALREPATTVVTVVETYANVDAFALHLAQSYIKEFIAKMEAAKVASKIRVFSSAE